MHVFVNKDSVANSPNILVNSDIFAVFIKISKLGDNIRDNKFRGPGRIYRGVCVSVDPSP